VASTLTTFSFALKTRYTDEVVANLVKADRPYLGLVKMNENFTGSSLVVPILDQSPQGVSATSLAYAQAVASNAGGAAFTLTTGNYYGSVYIGDKVLKQSKGNVGAFLDNQTAETDGLYETMADSLETHCFGNGGLSLGREAGTWTAGNTIILLNKEQICNFYVGMAIASDTADGSGAGDAVKTGYATITSISPEDGTITVNDIAGITGTFAQSDYLFRYGDFTGASTVTLIHGLGSFIYSTSSSVPALYSMTRSTDPTSRAGCRVPATAVVGKSIEERLQMLGTWMTGRYRTIAPDTYFLHPEDWQNLAIALQSRGVRALEDTSTKFGYMYLTVISGGKTAKIYTSRACPKGTCFGLNMKTWHLDSTQKLIHPQEEDGLTLLRAAATTDYEYRLLSYPVHYTNAPKRNGRVPVS
jgi:hypothetical protein